MYKTIKKLQTSGDKYSIVECGAGAIISNLLLSVPGASSLVDTCVQPYSKESQEKFLEDTFKRSVSVEWVLKAFKRVPGPCVITQFQVQTDDVKVLTHGYIGVRGKNGTAVYHMSIYKNFAPEPGFNCDEAVNSRELYFEIIEETVIKLMEKHSLDASLSLGNLHIDGVFFEDGFFDLETTIKIMGESNLKDTMIVIRDGEWSRMEDFTRDSLGLIIMRGSFNPLHKSHIELMAEARRKYPNYSPAFLISLNNRDKPALTYEEAVSRAVQIQDFGYNVIFSSLPYFNDSSSFLTERWPNKPIIYPVGMDTLNRIIEDIVKTEKDVHDIDWSKLKLNNNKPSEDLKEEWNEEMLKKPFWEIFHGKNWSNHKLLVFDRTGHTLTPYAKYFSKIIEIDSTYKDVNAISSTKIRNGDQKTGL